MKAKKVKIYLQYLIIIIGIFFSIIISLRNKSFYHKKFKIKKSGWESEISTSFLVKNNKLYDIFLKITYNEKYPFTNLHIKYSIEDTKNNTIFKEEKLEYNLFDEITGNPIGKGIFNKKIIILKLTNKVKFISNNIYSLSLEHYMRKNPLCGIEKIDIIIYET